MLRCSAAAAAGTCGRRHPCCACLRVSGKDGLRRAMLPLSPGALPALRAVNGNPTAVDFQGLKWVIIIGANGTLELRDMIIYNYALRGAATNTSRYYVGGLVSWPSISAQPGSVLNGGALAPPPPPPRPSPCGRRACSRRRPQGVCGRPLPPAPPGCPACLIRLRARAAQVQHHAVLLVVHALQPRGLPVAARDRAARGGRLGAPGPCPGGTCRAGRAVAALPRAAGCCPAPGGLPGTTRCRSARSRGRAGRGARCRRAQAGKRAARGGRLG